MRKLLLTTAAVAAAIAGAVATIRKRVWEIVFTVVGGAATLIYLEYIEPYGTFTDTRDGQIYRTVKTGHMYRLHRFNEKIWMAQNLNYKTTSGSWCYENNIFNCYKYGMLYSWDAAMTACPNGYHLPSIQDWDRLVNYAGGWKISGKYLKAKNDWIGNGNGKDAYRFSALPGGYRYSDSGFNNAGNYGYWWTATKYNANNAYSKIIYSSSNNVVGFPNNKSGGFSVRCVADRP